MAARSGSVACCVEAGREARERAEEAREALEMPALRRKGKPLDEIEKVYKERERQLTKTMRGEYR